MDVAIGGDEGVGDGTAVDVADGGSVGTAGAAVAAWVTVGGSVAAMVGADVGAGSDLHAGNNRVSSKPQMRMCRKV